MWATIKFPRNIESHPMNTRKLFLSGFTLLTALTSTLLAEDPKKTMSPSTNIRARVGHLVAGTAKLAGATAQLGCALFFTSFAAKECWKEATNDLSTCAPDELEKKQKEKTLYQVLGISGLAFTAIFARWSLKLAKSGINSIAKAFECSTPAPTAKS